MIVKKAVVVVLVAAMTPAAFAWGPLGHRIVAETAALLVADDLPTTWGPLIARHRFELGVYAYLPDARFRYIDGASGRVQLDNNVMRVYARRNAAYASNSEIFMLWMFGTSAVLPKYISFSMAPAPMSFPYRP